MTNPSYFDRYENLAFTRDDNGVLTMRFHTNGGPVVLTGQTHEDLPFALEEIAADEDNRAMILTGPDDDLPHPTFGIAAGDGLQVVWEEVAVWREPSGCSGAARTSTPVYLARRGRGAATFSTVLNSNNINVTAGLLIPATVIGVSQPTGSGLLVAGWYLGLTAVTLLLAYAFRGLNRRYRLDDHRPVRTIRRCPTGYHLDSQLLADSPDTKPSREDGAIRSAESPRQGSSSKTMARETQGWPRILEVGSFPTERPGARPTLAAGVANGELRPDLDINIALDVLYAHLCYDCWSGMAPQNNQPRSGFWTWYGRD